MTIKKNYEDVGDFKQPKSRRVVTKNREEQRVKHALRHGDLSVFDEEDFDGENFDEAVDYGDGEHGKVDPD